jgi:hypothetical protein
MPINITLPLEKTEGAIRNGHFRDTDNIRHTRNRTNYDRHYITQKPPYNPDDNSSDTRSEKKRNIVENGDKPNQRQT